MNFYPFDIYRPKKTKVRGGSTLDLIGPWTGYGQLQMHRKEITMIVDADEDIEVEDIVVYTEEV